MRRFGVFFLAMMTALFLEAQNGRRNFATGPSLSAQVQLGLPQNEFKEILSGYPAGAAFGLTLPIGSTGILRMGGEYAWNSLDEEKTLVELVDEASNVFTGNISSDTDVRSYLGFIRLSPSTSWFRPYGDIILGARSYTSDAQIEVEHADGTISEAGYALERQVKSTYGFAAGLALALGRNVFLDSKVEVLRGGNVSYIDQSTLQIDVNGDIDYSLKVTETDIVIPQVGLTVFF